MLDGGGVVRTPRRMNRTPLTPVSLVRLATLVTVAPLAIAVAVGACGSSSSSSSPGTPVDGDASAADDADSVDASTAADTSVVDAKPDVDKSAPCAKTFGTALTASFGRLDGTVVAVLPPNDQACTAPNATHMIIQVSMGGAVYRMVVDVLSNQGSPDVLFDEIDAPLAAGAWAEGWHAGAALDYVTTLGVHSPAFTAMHQADIVAQITSEIDLGAHISVFATATSAEPDSAHLVHRNLTNADGAIVVRPDSATPHYMLIRFGEQVF